jgi:NAD(P)-dependent dehydrogenase (short-subunit alcohol dehydrogenase family)
MSVKKLFDLSGKVAVVTGGSRGLGLQIAEALGEMGAKLIITARKQAELDQARSHLGALGIDVSTHAADLGKTEGARSIADAVLTKFGRVDVLVNNAGTTWGAPTEDTPLDAWMKVVNLNLTGTFLLTQEIGRRSMIPNRRGHIVNIASVAGLLGNPTGMKTIAYNTTKGGLVSFTRALAAEWGAYGINVNAIAPGFFPSKMAAATLAQIGDAVIEQTPLGRLGGDEDLKGLAVLLASDASRHMTGQIIAVDGGASCI